MASTRPIDSSTSSPIPIAAFPRSEPRFETGLSQPLTRLIGRDREVAALIELLQKSDTRVVTLTGPGGVGKTRLALEVGREVNQVASDAVKFVDLTPIVQPGAFLSAIATCLGVRESNGRQLMSDLKAFLRDRRTLLILDNFEQILDAAPLLADLLGACPQLSALVTSRVVLRLSGEYAFPLPPLPLPAAASSVSVSAVQDIGSIQLFVERARHARGGFDLTTENAPIIAEICRRLDGLPLALELAAARIRVLPPAMLLARLDRRLPLLTGGARDIPARQQTLRATIAWSHDLLSPSDQVLFRRLAVFAGGFTIEAAEEVCGSEPGGGERQHDTTVRSTFEPVLDGLASLVDQSLLRALDDPVEGTVHGSRFSLLETIREFALEQLEIRGESDGIREAHAAYFLALAEREERASFVLQAEGVVARLNVEHANLIAALTWFQEKQNVPSMLRLAVGLHWFWSVRGYLREGRNWLEGVLAQSDDTVDPTLRVRALMGLGRIIHYQGDQVGAGQQYDHALTIARSVGDVLGVVSALSGLGALAAYRQDYEQATLLGEEALLLLPSLADPALAASYSSSTLSNLGFAAHGLGNLALARDRFEQALAGFRSAGNIGGLIRALQHSASLARDEGDMERALSHYRESLTLALDSGDERIAAAAFAGIATIAATFSEYESAASLFGVAKALRARSGSPIVSVPFDRDAYARAEALSRACLGDAAYERAWAHGQSLSLSQALAFADDLDPRPAPSSAPTSLVQFGLTERERHVLPLLVDGLSDREIAEELLITRRTVQGHVASIFAKFGVHSRTAVAAVAISAGYTPAPRVGATRNSGSLHVGVNDV